MRPANVPSGDDGGHQAGPHAIPQADQWFLHACGGPLLALRHKGVPHQPRRAAQDRGPGCLCPNQSQQQLHTIPGLRAQDGDPLCPRHPSVTI